MKHAALVFTALLALSSFTASAQTDLVTRRDAVGHRDFRKAKEVLPRVHAGLNTTFYCGCRYTGKTVDHKTCGYKIRKDANRASRLEWEHVVPAWVLGHQRRCWQQGGRKQCTKNDAVFRKAEGDLHNLTPAIGEINNDRANFRFTVWDNNPSMYGQCGMTVDFKKRRAQPPQQARGKIARTTFYMVERYKLNMNAQERRLYCVWAKTYPVDKAERIRNQRIAAIQGNSNRFVADANAIKSVCK
ncbi:MAG TPA: endonuclease [Eoetvoesiella sp.]